MSRARRVVTIATAAALWALAGTRALAAGGGAIDLSPASLDFVRPGEGHAVAVRNRGSGPLGIGGVRIVSSSNVPTTDFTADPVAPQILPPGGTITVAVRYTGPASQRAFGALLVLADDPDLPEDAGGAMALAAAEGAGRQTVRVAPVALRAGARGGLFGLLTWIVLAPLLGLPFLLLAPRRREPLARAAVLVATGLDLALALVVAVRFRPDVSLSTGDGLQFAEHYTLVHALSLEYFMGVDGLSLGFVVLVALAGFAAALAAQAPGRRDRRRLLGFVLVLLAAVQGVLLSLDAGILATCWVATLAATAMLMRDSVGPRAFRAYLVRALPAAVLLLVGVAVLHGLSGSSYLVDGTPGAHSFDLSKLSRSDDLAHAGTVLGLDAARLVFVLLFVGFVALAPLVPLHAWLVDAVARAPRPAAVVLAVVPGATALYGLARVAWPVAPSATRWACGLGAGSEASVVGLLAVATVAWAALGALAQSEPRRLIAYLGVVQVGASLLGLASGTQAGFLGAVAAALCQGVVAIVILVAAGDGGAVAPAGARRRGAVGVALAAASGVPALAGFPGHLLVVLGAFTTLPVLTLAASLGLVVAGAAALRPLAAAAGAAVGRRDGGDLGLPVTLFLAPLALALVLLGAWPFPVLSTLAASITDLATRVAP